jgi:hypothetical protein
VYNGSKDTVYLEPPNLLASIGETETGAGGNEMVEMKLLVLWTRKGR